MKFGYLIFRKITKFVATRRQILRLKCTKFNFGWGSVAWNSLPEHLRQITSVDLFKRSLSENVLIRADVVFSALETFHLMGYISLLTMLQTDHNKLFFQDIKPNI